MPSLSAAYRNGWSEKAKRHARIRAAELEARGLTPKSVKAWMVVGRETGISHTYHATRAEAEAEARRMTEYHQKAYDAVERN